MAGFAEFRLDIISTHKSKTPWCILNSDCSLGLTKLQIKKNVQNGYFGSKMVVFAIFEGVAWSYMTCNSSISK